MWIARGSADRFHRVTFHCSFLLVDAGYCTQQEYQNPGDLILIPSLSCLAEHPSSSSLIVLNDCCTTYIQVLSESLDERSDTSLHLWAHPGPASFPPWPALLTCIINKYLMISLEVPSLDLSLRCHSIVVHLLIPCKAPGFFLRITIKLNEKTKNKQNRIDSCDITIPGIKLALFKAYERF